MDPPPCVQNAMLTKDKKPFTYTPGGIDLSEVRSPRMQRRIERNANLGGAGDTPKPPPPQQNVGPLPPSALAAMRPQTQVQVFPGPPPPPPMQKNIPPPPPPPSCPLPTQKVTTGDNQVLERPDMTKIIPENPMALLRKTGGPAPRKSLVEQMYEEGNTSPPSPPQRTYQPPASASPPQRAYQPPAPASPPQRVYQPPAPASPPQRAYQPPAPATPPQRTYQPPAPVSPSPPQTSSYQPPVIERQPTQPQRNVSSSVGSLYIPPLNQQKVASPPTPPERQHQVQSPGTPTLKEAPRPWQQKSTQQQEIPPWARRDEDERLQAPQAPPNVQQRWQQPAPSRQPVQPPNSYPVHIEIRTGGSYPPEPSPEERKPNAVYVTQPVVLQHPGPRIAPPYQAPPKPQPQPRPQPPIKVDSSGARIIPIQIERTPPSTPGADRTLNRQQSWGSQPTQSNSFKVIQRFTRTDDDDDDDTPVTQHSPRYPQEMPEQVRRMKISDNGHLGQGNGQPQQYVHPSEQVVPEPKKYMGSNIPSRSFKILQAMTAPTDSCGLGPDQSDF